LSGFAREDTTLEGKFRGEEAKRFRIGRLGGEVVVLPGVFSPL
jgi:hypothetical protein